FRPSLRPPDAFPFDGIAGFAQTGRICEDHGISSEIQPHLKHVAGGARLFGNNGDITIGYRIDQRAFSSIRGAYHRYIEAFPQYLAAPVIIQMHLDLFEDGAELLAALSDRTRRNVLVGEIDSSLDPASRTDQAG